MTFFNNDALNQFVFCTNLLHDLDNNSISFLYIVKHLHSFFIVDYEYFIYNKYNLYINRNINYNLLEWLLSFFYDNKTEIINKNNKLFFDIDKKVPLEMFRGDYRRITPLQKSFIISELLDKLEDTNSEEFRNFNYFKKLDFDCRYPLYNIIMNTKIEINHIDLEELQFIRSCQYPELSTFIYECDDIITLLPLSPLNNELKYYDVLKELHLEYLRIK